MRMKLSKIGELNPMFDKEKYPEIIEQCIKIKKDLTIECLVKPTHLKHYQK